MLAWISVIAALLAPLLSMVTVSGTSLSPRGLAEQALGRQENVDHGTFLVNRTRVIFPDAVHRMVR